MKRRIIRLAGKTHVVSLPSKWVKKYDLKKGEEIDLEEKGNSILINTAKGAATEKVTLDSTELDERVIRWALSALHKSGHDEIEVIYNSKKTLDLIQELVKDLFMGFAIMEQTEKRCVLKSIARDVEEEFDATLRRAFLVTLSMGESCIELIRKGKLGSLRDLINLEHTNNQLTNFCERILNKRGYKDYRKTNFLYTVVWNLEKICDDYKYICEYLSSRKIKVSKEIIFLFEKINSLVRNYYELFYKFDLQKLNDMNKEKIKIKKEINNLVKNQSAEEIILINHLSNLLTKTADFSAGIIALNQEEFKGKL